MPDYVQDPNDSQKQVPGAKTDQHFTRGGNPISCSFTKAPSYVVINDLPVQPIGFFFGSSASFAAKATTEGDPSTTTAGDLTGSQHYISYGKPAAGTTLHINPNAWSGSVGDAGKITFVYKGGLDGMGRP